MAGRPLRRARRARANSQTRKPIELRLNGVVGYEWAQFQQAARHVSTYLMNHGYGAGTDFVVIVNGTMAYPFWWDVERHALAYGPFVPPDVRFEYGVLRTDRSSTREP